MNKSIEEPLRFEAFAKGFDKSEYSANYWDSFNLAEQRDIYQRYLVNFKSPEPNQVASTTSNRVDALNLLDSAKIANLVIGKFNFDEMLELSVFFETSQEAVEAASLSHAKLKPNYEAAIQSWYMSNTELTADLITPLSIQPSVNKSMQLGLTAVLKKLGWDKNSLTASEPQPSAENTTSSSAQIKKKRSWSEIKKDNH